MRGQRNVAAEVGLAAGLGNRTFSSGDVGSILPFTASTVLLNFSRLDVTFEEGGAPLEGAKVSVAEGRGLITAALTGSDGNARFYLPAGGYTISAVGVNITAGEDVTLQAGGSLRMTLGGPTQGKGDGVFQWLVLAAVAGLGANILLFARRSRSGKPRRPIPTARSPPSVPRKGSRAPSWPSCSRQVSRRGPA